MLPPLGRLAYHAQWRCDLEARSHRTLHRLGAAAADFGNGIGAALPFESFRFLNADLRPQLHRLPVGDWVCLDAVSYPEPAGVGVAESTLSDPRGRIGRALQSLLIERR